MSKIVVEEVELIKSKNLGRGSYLFEMTGCSKIKSIRPGQFIHIRLPHTDIYFRRAFSIYDVDMERGTISILFKVFGRGTALMTGLKTGTRLDILGPLGNGFKIPSKKMLVVLAGGGVGMPPLYFLAKRLMEKNYDKKQVSFFYGGVTKDDLVELARIKKMGINVYTSTDDGSSGYHGFVTGAIEKNIDLTDKSIRIFACGPEGMLKAIDRLALANNVLGQLSLEAPMPCGIGICLGCIMPLREGGNTRVCREGPVYNIGEVLL